MKAITGTDYLQTNKPAIISKNGFIDELVKKKELFAMAFPALALVFVFNYIPMFGVVLAFKNFNYADGFFRSPWCGFDNFKFLFATDAAFQITRNTILYNVAFIILGLIIPVAIAIILNEIRNRLLTRIYQTVFIMPFFLSWVVISFAAYAFMGPGVGYLDSFLAFFGAEPVMWYSSPEYWPFILIFFHTWKVSGYTSVIYLASITGIANEYYEAAKIDGASKWLQMTNITLPFLKPMMIILTILAIGRIFYSDFGLFYQLPRDSGILYPVTNVIDVYVYNGLKNMGNTGMSAAANFYQSIIGFILVLASNLAVRKIEKEYALF